MSDERSLLIGIDLGEEYTQINNYNKKKMEPEPVSFSSEKEDYVIPTCLCVKKTTKEWLIGQEARQCSNRDQGELITGLLSKLNSGSNITIYGQDFSAVVLLEKFFKKIFSGIRQVFPGKSIKKLVVTVKELEEQRKQHILEALKKLGFDTDRVMILSNIQCFMYYTISQKPEIWSNDVALFDYSKQGLMYYQLSFYRKIQSPVVLISQKSLKEGMPYEMVAKEEPERLCYHFEDLAKQILYKKTISSIYVTGSGFEGNAIDPALRNLCIGRRVFKGQNLYTKGACYAAHAIDSGSFDTYTFIDEEAITAEIGIIIYQDAKEQQITLADFGTPWKQVNQKFYAILDNTEELHFVVSSLQNKEQLHEIMKLDGLMKRENKTIRISIQLHFEDRETAVVTVRDTGFGTFYENSYRIWEQILKL